MMMNFITIEQIGIELAEKICRTITDNLPEYFGILSANEQYFNGIKSCYNFAAQINNQYVGLLALNFPHANNSHIYWLGVMHAYHNKGIAQKLLYEAQQFARQAYASTMTVETLSPQELNTDYLKTYQFYESNGFKPLLTLKPEGYEWNMIYMIKSLDNALHELLYLENDASAFGFEWPNHAMIIEQAINECDEIKEALLNNEGSDRIQEEIGDLLHSVVSLCNFEGFSIEDTLIKVNEKFSKRMQIIKSLTHELKLSNLKGQSFEFMLELWNKAKINT